MRKFFNLAIKSALMMFVAVAMLSCSGKSKAGKEYFSLIPENASVVISADLNRLQTDANLTTEQWNALLNSMKISAFKDSGIANDAKTFFFLLEKNTFGILAKVADKDKLKPTIEMLKTEMGGFGTEKKEVNGYTLEISDDTAIAYNSEVILVIGKNDYFANMSPTGYIGENDTSISTLVENILNGTVASLSANESAKAIFAGNDDINIMMNLKYFKAMSDFGISFAAINFEAGKIVLTSSSSDSEMQKQLIALSAKPSYKFDKFFPASSPMYVYAAINPNADFAFIIEMLKTQINNQKAQMATLTGSPVNGQMDAVYNKMITIYEKIFNSMSGDFAIALTSTAMVPQVAIYADVKNSDFLDYILTLIPSGVAKEKSKDEYTVSLGFVNILFGIKNNVFYLTNDMASYNAFVADKALEPNFSSSPFAAKCKGTYGGYELRIAEILSSPLVAGQLGQMGMSKIPFLSDIETMEIVSENIETGEFVILMKDKTANPLHTIATLLVNASE